MEENDVLSMDIKKLQDSIELQDKKSIEKNANEFFNEWNKNDFLNSFYRKSDLDGVMKNLTEFYLTHKINIDETNKDILLNFPIKDLKNILIKNQDFIADDTLKIFEDKIIQKGGVYDLIEFAGVKGVDFERIQNKILESTNTVALKDFFETYKDKADLNRVYNRVYIISKGAGSAELKRTRENSLKTLQVYVKEARRKEQEEYENSLDTNNFRRGRQY